ncbi:cAMP-specific 3',5'-cyclic phosphodiesterase 4B [Bagarius yarrelli]|uniref:cAMP-specific 3',5'-cyclic phosphodiesterase 4B n=1 Tax=Bagarius yarrelli TaxID=175774 RepID=A0A556VYE8_BAGYA|nr:cAMP-specific 3',5'-cyclic phosphodiesterase 4B [Bagarius yarrelli]
MYSGKKEMEAGSQLRGFNGVEKPEIMNKRSTDPGLSMSTGEPLVVDLGPYQRRASGEKSGVGFEVCQYSWSGETPHKMRKSRSVLNVSPCEDSKDRSDCSLSESFTSTACTLGVDLRRGRRRFSGNLQLPPLSWRQPERSRTPDEEIVCRPTTLPFIRPPRIDITPVDSECVEYKCCHLEGSIFLQVEVLQF